MLIDSTHRRWVLVCTVVAVAAVAVYLVWDWVTPGGLTGGSTIGLWYGTVGSVLMIWAGLLSAHRRLPSRPWLGKRSAWLKSHLWLGTLSGVFLFCHAHWRLGGVLTTALSLVTIGVLATGWLGVWLQNWLPRQLASRAPAEAPYDQHPHLCRVMRRRADLIVDEVCGPVTDGAQAIQSTQLAAKLAEDGKAQLRGFYELVIRPFFDLQPPRGSPMRSTLQTETRFAKLRQLEGLDEHGPRLDELIGLCEERRQLLEQERVHFWLHGWLALHIPLSAALLVLGAAHVVTALYY